MNKLFNCTYNELMSKLVQLSTQNGGQFTSVYIHRLMEQGLTTAQIKDVIEAYMVSWDNDSKTEQNKINYTI